MNKDIELKLIEACKQNKADKTTSLGSREHISEISKYLSQQRFNNEIDKIFKKLPSILIHSTMLPEHDSFQSVDSHLGSLIVSRDTNGKAHVFRNGCRHRGAKLVNNKGCGKRMVCPYHAWSYSTDGKLANVPGERHCFPNLDKESNGLLEIASVEQYGFIWICPEAENNKQASMHLAEHLGDMASHMQWLAPHELTAFKQKSRIWNGNWKLFAEGGLETYHFAFTHKDSIAPYFYNNTAVIDEISQHFRVVMPTKELENDNLTSLHDCSHTLLYLMPNTALLIQKEHVDWIQFRAIVVDKTEITITSLIPKNADLTDENQHAHWEKNHNISNSTLDEDWT